MNTRLIMALILMASLSGCAKLSHLQELLTLKGYADATQAQEKYIKSQDARFDKMLAAVRDGSINNYKEQRSFRKVFGDPVYIREVQKDGAPCREWLYRYAARYFNSDKVYLYFAEDGNFLKWEYVPQEKERTNG